MLMEIFWKQFFYFLHRLSFFLPFKIKRYKLCTLFGISIFLNDFLFVIKGRLVVALATSTDLIVSGLTTDGVQMILRCKDFVSRSLYFLFPKAQRLQMKNGSCWKRWGALIMLLFCASNHSPSCFLSHKGDTVYVFPPSSFLIHSFTRESTNV